MGKQNMKEIGLMGNKMAMVLYKVVEIFLKVILKMG
jgi:hypothetical protein